MQILVIQYNYKQNYENIIIILKNAISINVEIVMVQKLFYNNEKKYHSRFIFYCLLEKRKILQVIIIVKKNLRKIMVD